MSVKMERGHAPRHHSPFGDRHGFDGEEKTARELDKRCRTDRRRRREELGEQRIQA
jgi:hypothetical protein